MLTAVQSDEEGGPIYRTANGTQEVVWSLCCGREDWMPDY